MSDVAAELTYSVKAVFCSLVLLFRLDRSFLKGHINQSSHCEDLQQRLGNYLRDTQRLLATTKHKRTFSIASPRHGVEMWSISSINTWCYPCQGGVGPTGSIIRSCTIQKHFLVMAVRHPRSVNVNTGRSDRTIVTSLLASLRQSLPISFRQNDWFCCRVLRVCIMSASWVFRTQCALVSTEFAHFNIKVDPHTSI